MRCFSVSRILSMALAGAFALGLTACGSSSPQETTGMTASTELSAMHYCTKVSPEILVSNPPKTTGYYEVRLDRVGPDAMFLGGGTWAYGGVDEDGIDHIIEGGLTSHYRGPCSRPGKKDTYVYTVQAMPEGGGTPLATSTITVVVGDE